MKKFFLGFLLLSACADRRGPPADGSWRFEAEGIGTPSCSCKLNDGPVEVVTKYVPEAPVGSKVIEWKEEDEVKPKKSSAADATPTTVEEEDASEEETER